MLSFILLSTSTPAHAYVYWGNPEFKLSIDRTEGDLVSGVADLAGIRVHKCGGGYTDYVADETIDPIVPWTTTIEGGDLCAVEVLWDSVVQVWSSAFALKSNSASHVFYLEGATAQVPLTPFVVTGGTFSGSTPNIHVAFD